MRNQSASKVLPIDDKPGSEKSPPQRAADEDDEDCVASFTKALTASVAGPMWEKVLYYIVLLVAVGFFAYNSVSVLHRWATETVTTIKVVPPGSVIMPTVMVALPHFGSWGSTWVDQAVRPQCPLSSYGNCADIAFKEVAWASTTANGSDCLTCWYSMNGVFSGTFPSKDKLLHQSLLDLVGMTTYAYGEKFVIYTLNSPGTVLSTPAKQIMLKNKFSFDFSQTNMQTNQSTKAAQIYIGLLDPGVSTFAGGQLWVGGAFNKINTLKITVEKTIDETKGGTVTYEYQGTLSEIAKETNIEASTQKGTTADPKVKTDVQFEMGSFSMRQITIRHMSFSEVYAGIGGCWAAAALIVGIFFNEKVGGTRGKVQVFRFKGPKGRKAIAQLAAKQLGGLLMDKVKDEVAEAMPDVPVEMPGKINGANVPGDLPVDGFDGMIPEEGTGEAPGSIQEGQNELLASIASQAGKKALKFAIARLRPKLEPKIKQKGLTWEDILPILQSFDTPDELLEAFEDPEAFFLSLAKKSGPLGIKIAIILLRPKLEPKLEKKGLKWADILPILELVDTPEELSAAIEDPEAFLESLAKKSGPLGIKITIILLRPKLEPKLKEKGLTWEDILPILELVDTPDELSAAVTNPEEFLQNMARKCGALGIKIAIILLRPKLEPQLEKRGLKWKDILPILELVDTPDELSSAVQNPEAFLESLAKKCGALGIKITIILLRPKLEPKLEKQGLKWGDILPILELVDTPDELSAAVTNPEAFLQNMARKCGALGIKIAIILLRPKLEPKLEKQGLKWKDILPILELVDTPDELSAAVQDPDAFLESLAKQSAALAIKIAIIRLRPKLEPKLEKQGLKWEDVLPILELVDTPNEVLAAVEDPDAFLQKLAKKSAVLGIKIAIINLRPKLEPQLEKQGLKWGDVLPIIELVDTLDELLAAVQNPDKFLESLAKKSGALGIKFAAIRLRSKLEPKLKKHGLKWEDVLPILELVDTPDELLGAIEDPEAFLKKLANKSAAVGIKVAIARLRPKQEPKVEKQGLKWEDIVPVLEMFDKPEELMAAIENPDMFLETLAKKSGVLGIQFAIVRLRPKLEPKLQKLGLQWADILPVLQCVDTPNELLAAVENPTSFMDNLAQKSEACGKKLAIARLRLSLEPKLKKQGLQWEDALPHLLLINTRDELLGLAQNSDALLQKFVKRTSGRA